MFSVVQEANADQFAQLFFQQDFERFFCVLLNNYVNPGDTASVWLLSDSSACLELRYNCSKAWLKQSNEASFSLKAAHQSELA